MSLRKLQTALNGFVQLCKNVTVVGDNYVHLNSTQILIGHLSFGTIKKIATLEK